MKGGIFYVIMSCDTMTNFHGLFVTDLLTRHDIKAYIEVIQISKTKKSIL